MEIQAVITKIFVIIFSLLYIFLKIQAMKRGSACAPSLVTFSLLGAH